MNRHQRRAAAAAERAATDRRFRMERNTVLRSLDVRMMDALFIRWKRPLPRMWATDKPNAQLAVMHLARLHVPEMTEEEKVTSAQWLVDNTYSLPPGITFADGKLTGVPYGDTTTPDKPINFNRSNDG